MLARPGQARERLHQALDAAGALIVLEEDPNALDAAALAAAAPRAVLVALEPAVEDALEALEPALEAPGLLVIFDEADLAARRDGWEAQRWIRHLAAKLYGHDDVLPPGREQDIALDLQPGHPPTPQQAHEQDRFEPHLAEAEALAAGLPQDRPGMPPSPPPPQPAPDWALTDAAEPQQAPPAKAVPPPLPDFSQFELVALEEASLAGAASSAAEPAAAAVAGPSGAVLVIAGIGGPDAVRKLLVALPRGFRQPVLVQLRLDGGRYDNLVKQMARVSALPVLMAATGEALVGARVYVLPEGVGVDAGEDGGLHFAEAQAGAETVAVLPPEQSAVLLLSGADPARVDAALALAARGGHVSGQALEGCYDATAVRLLAAGGMELGTPAQLAERLAQRWG
nr:chemotaxis protein CheB [Pseudoxanthomonas broegbernensis]